MGPNPDRPVNRQSRWAWLIFHCVFATGCSTLLSIAVPSHNQSVDLSTIPSGSYVLDKRHAHLLFSVDHMGFSKAIGRFNTFDATFTFDNSKPQASQLTVTIDTASVDTGDATLDLILQNSTLFYSSKYPEARFESSQLSVQSEHDGHLVGTLTFKGRSQPVVLDVYFAGGAKDTLLGHYKLGFSAKSSFPRSAFGVAGFLPLVGDEVTLMIEAEFILETEP